VPGVVVETVQRHHSRQWMRDDLALLDAAASGTEPLATLATGLPELLLASYCLIVEPSLGTASARTVAATVSAPDSPCQSAWLPLRTARQLSAAEVWADPRVAGPDCELAAVPFRTAAAILLGRIGGPAFRPAELTRLGHLSRVAQALLPEIG
jgi:hypothetical protein